MSTLLAPAPSAAQTTTPPSILLTAENMLPEIEAALSAQGMPNGAAITLNQPQQTFPIASDVEFSHVSYNALSGRFVIRLPASPAAITGFARLVEQYPVVTRSIERGERISDDDIAYIQTAEWSGRSFIRDAASLAGMEARRPLSPQQPIRTSDVAAPILVKRGALVTLTYAAAGLRLTHQGVALDSGSAGAIITVENAHSERTLKGVVKQHNVVEILAPQRHVEG